MGWEADKRQVRVILYNMEPDQENNGEEIKILV